MVMEAYSVKMLDGDYLEHHGIKGQHWGERNGPPYPLNKISTEKLHKKHSRAVEKVVEQRDGKGTHIKKGAALGAIIGASHSLTADLVSKKSAPQTAVNTITSAGGGAIGGAIGSALGAKVFANYNDQYISNIERELRRRGESFESYESVLKKARSTPASSISPTFKKTK